MRILVTRPGAEGESLAIHLNDIGVDTLLEPLLTVKDRGVNGIKTDGVQAYLATSANGIRALVRTKPDFTMPLFAVGDATATSARQGGFKTVHSASGDVEALTMLVKDILEPKNGSLIYAAGSSQAGDLLGTLSKLGFNCRQEVLYETLPTRSFSPDTIASIKANTIDVVLLYSPKTAEIFVDLVRKSRLVRSCQTIKAACLSQEVAEKIKGISWNEIVIAREPTHEALMKTLDGTDRIRTPLEGQIETEKNTLNDGKGNTIEQPLPSLGQIKTGAVKTIFFTLLISAGLFSGASATSDLWLPRIKILIPFLKYPNKAEIQITNIIGRLNKLETRTLENLPRLEELEAERLRLQNQLDITLSRINTLEGVIKTTKQMVKDVDASQGPKETKKTLKNLIERLTQLESVDTAERTKNKEQLGELASKVAQLEVTGPTNPETNKARAFLIAVGQLGSAIRLGNPFYSELSALNTLTLTKQESTVATDFLENYATTGVLTIRQLHEHFRNLAGKVVQSAKIPESNDLFGQIFSRVSESLNWRRTDLFEGTSVEAIVARTERALENNKVQMAITELSSLPAKSKKTVEPWLQSAKAHVAANKTLAALQSNAISLLTTKE